MLITCCPVCGTECKPQVTIQDIQINVNWDSLRILSTYAFQWMIRVNKNPIKGKEKLNQDATRALENILVALGKFQPKDSLPLVDKKILMVIRNGVPMNGEKKKDEGIPSPYLGI